MKSFKRFQSQGWSFGVVDMAGLGIVKLGIVQEYPKERWLSQSKGSLILGGSRMEGKEASRRTIPGCRPFKRTNPALDRKIPVR